MDVDVFHVLADPVRRRIVESLAGHERAVGEIVGLVDIQQSGVSRHLRILAETGFVTMRADGTRRLYSLSADRFRDLDRWVQQYRTLWDARLDRFGVALDQATTDSKETP